MAKVKHEIRVSKYQESGVGMDVNKFLHITYETNDVKQIPICTEYIEDFANDFEERFINVPVIPEDRA